jgi:hypothetical protein
MERSAIECDETAQARIIARALDVGPGQALG